MQRLSTVRMFSVAALTLGLGACAMQPQRDVATGAPADDWSVAAAALRGGAWADAEPPLARLVQQDLRNGHLQFLYALAQENSARKTDRARLQLAEVGYANAARFASGNYWALLRLGALELERGDWAAAQSRFAEAALDQPQRWEAFYGLGVASYHRQDTPLLYLAAKRTVQLASEREDAQRLAALALAVQGEPEAMTMARRAARLNDDPAEDAYFERRVAEYLELAQADTGTASDAGIDDTAAAPVRAARPEPAPTQVVVEVTILLSSMLNNKNRGVNLFDGLRVLYGYSNVLQQFSEGLTRQSTRTITSQISSPQLDYSLNLFNDSGQYYNVVARPSITAHLGRESQFFAGRTINVEVSGVNLGSLQPIDVGVQLVVTPEYIDNRRVTFRLDASRSFLTQEQIGTFENSLALFRQSVGATADVEFGQTLVLSALSEQVQDKSFSKVPVVGDVPVANWLTSHSVDSQRQESLLILVTPSLPLSYDTPDSPGRRSKTVESLLELWHQRVDPNSDVNAIIKRLERSHWLRTPKRGDLKLRVGNEPADQREAIEESLMLGRV
ncbi:hypothetical protein [Sinimarinibacterium sp. CAU 1509]|uniref:hypothetical protein n=1 Tax=Sinimarinibacterium sp. CAU 1509 TaxID=2562283 RepID=UPI001B7F881B|nr:hypothetical protein [Sinimarinibacterium sp. CAU 1509]